MIFKPGLYIISTPIGNLDDITLRAIQALKNLNIIFCEDTRTSRKLLVKHGIKAKLQIYNDHSDSKARDNISSLIDQGMVVALISDAGTPLISDPGYKLVKELKERGVNVDVIPGVSAPIAALTLSGLPSDRFLFAGFLPKTAIKKRKILEEFANLKATLIFFETATRLNESLNIIYEVYGNRQVCVARELTKLHQEARLATVKETISYYSQHPAKGEIALLISSMEEERDALAINQKLEEYIKNCFSKGITSKTATEKAFKKFGDFYSKKEIYKIVNNIKA